MILKTNGKAYTIDGRTYIVGSEIAAVPENPYYGLIGTITEIRTGKDKETDNRTADIYCSFDLPAIPWDKKQLTERFSKLYGKPVQLEEINFDRVIMAPEMIMLLVGQMSETIIYIVSEEWNGDGGCGSDIFIYTDPEGAKAKFRQLVRDEKRDGAVSEWLDEDDFMEESTETYYSAWLDNDYDGYHYNLFLEEKEIIRTLTIV